MIENYSSERDPLSNVHEFGLISLLYVSRSSLSLEGDYKAVGDIVQTALARNAALRISGALIYTELHFAQVLEGPESAVGELMTSIVKDARHSDVTVVARRPVARRRFGSWTMAYNGPSAFLDRHVKPLVASRTAPRDADKLVEQLLSNIQRLYDL